MRICFLLALRSHGNRVRRKNLIVKVKLALSPYQSPRLRLWSSQIVIALFPMKKMINSNFSRDPLWHLSVSCVCAILTVWEGGINQFHSDGARNLLLSCVV
jgi:hypothetical protein